MRRMNANDRRSIMEPHFERLGISDCLDAIMRICQRSPSFTLGLPILVGVGTAKDVLRSAVREISNAQRGQIKADLDFLTARLEAVKAAS